MSASHLHPLSLSLSPSLRSSVHPVWPCGSAGASAPGPGSARATWSIPSPCAPCAIGTRWPAPPWIGCVPPPERPHRLNPPPTQTPLCRGRPLRLASRKRICRSCGSRFHKACVLARGLLASPRSCRWDPSHGGAAGTAEGVREPAAGLGCPAAHRDRGLRKVYRHPPGVAFEHRPWPPPPHHVGVAWQAQQAEQESAELGRLRAIAEALQVVPRGGGGDLGEDRTSSPHRTHCRRKKRRSSLASASGRRSRIGSWRLSSALTRVTDWPTAASARTCPSTRTGTTARTEGPSVPVKVSVTGSVSSVAASRSTSAAT